MTMKAASATFRFLVGEAVDNKSDYPESPRRANLTNLMDVQRFAG
jgi:hypothetical protein